MLYKSVVYLQEVGPGVLNSLSSEPKNIEFKTLNTYNEFLYLEFLNNNN